MIMPRPTAHKTRDSPTLMSDCEPSRHNPGIGIMAPGRTAAARSVRSVAWS